MVPLNKIEYLIRNDVQSIVVLPLILVLIVAGGCISASPATNEPGGASDQSPITGGSFQYPASVYITYPDFDGGVDAGNVTVTIMIRNFSVVNRFGRQNEAGEGHIIYFKDTVPPTKQGYPAVTEPGTFQISAQTWCTWYNVSPGTHTFAAELVNNDNTPLEPPVIDTVDVTAVRRVSDIGLTRPDWLSG